MSEKSEEKDHKPLDKCLIPNFQAKFFLTFSLEFKKIKIWKRSKIKISKLISKFQKMAPVDLNSEPFWADLIKSKFCAVLFLRAKCYSLPGLWRSRSELRFCPSTCAILGMEIDHPSPLNQISSETQSSVSSHSFIPSPRNPSPTERHHRSSMETNRTKADQLNQQLSLLISLISVESESLFSAEHVSDEASTGLIKSISNDTLDLLLLLSDETIDEIEYLRMARYSVPRISLPKNTQWISEVLPNLPDNHFTYHCRMSRSCFATICNMLDAHCGNVFYSLREEGRGKPFLFNSTFFSSS